jgi:hypothetical protein
MPRSPSKVNPWIVAAAVLAALTVLGAQLLRPPVLGLADNGDYQRVMAWAGLDHSTDVHDERYFAFLRTTYRILPLGSTQGGYISSEALIALAARLAATTFGAGTVLDLRVLAAIHIALYVLAFGLMLRAARGLEPAAQLLAAALLVFFFTDIGYIGPFNSFYSQTASLLFLMLTAALAAEAVARGELSGARLVLFYVCAAGFVTSKPQEAIQGPLLALLGVRLAGVGLRGASRKPAVWLAIALCALSAWYGRQTPMTLREAALYQVVFYEVLAHSPDPAADAAALGLDPAWLRYAGTDAFQPDSPLIDPAFRVRFLGSVGFRKVAAFYLGHPGRAVERLRRISRKIWSLRPSYGNLERSAEHPRLTLTDRDAAWSRFRLRTFGALPITALVLLFAGNAAAALGTWRKSSLRGRRFRETVLAAVLMSATAFVVCFLTNAPPDFSRVFYVAQALCDLLIVVDASWLVQTLSVRHAARR